MNKFEIIVFTNGNSNDIKTWSNVPFLFTSTLERCSSDYNIIVHRCDTRPFVEKFIPAKIILRVIDFGLGLVFGRYCWIETTKTYGKIIKYKMKKEIKKYPNSDCIFSFSFSDTVPSFKGKKVLFHDWTIQYAIEEHLQRQPQKFEWKVIERQEKGIKDADYVITFLPNVYEKLSLKFGDKIKYIGQFINILEPFSLDDSIINERYETNDIVFIGKAKYKPALIELEKAVLEYNKKHNGKWKINVIGMKNTTNKSDFCQFYGYLDKKISYQREEYYSILKKSKIIVNTMDDWFGISSILEGMYYGLPIIVNPNIDTYETFGKNISFGYYVDSNNSNLILNAIDCISNISLDEYRKMSIESRNAVNDYTWENYINKFLKLLLD